MYNTIGEELIKGRLRAIELIQLTPEEEKHAIFAAKSKKYHGQQNSEFWQVRGSDRVENRKETFFELEKEHRNGA